MKKWNKSLKNIFSVILIVIMVVSLPSCKSKSDTQKELNIFIDTTDEYSAKVIKFLIEDFKKDNPDFEIKLNDALGDKTDIMEKINIGTKIDVIFSDRNTLIELNKRGVLSDLQDTYSSNAISDRFYKIMGSYGRIGDKYYGIGVVPYSIELLYNKANLEKLKISNPKNSDEWLNVLKQINEKGIKTPVVLTENIDANGYLFSLLGSKVINVHEFEQSYDSGEESYKKLTNVQGIFNEFNDLTKNNTITKNSFELGNQQTISNFNSSDSPLLICTSYFNTNLTGSNIGLIENYDNGSNVPIIINSILSVPLNAKNADNANAFIKYIYNDEVQAKIVQKGIISGNKIANNKISGIGKLMVQHMYKANDNSMLILYNLPKIIKNNVLITLKRILDGGYNSKEWEDIIKESYK